MKTRIQDLRKELGVTQSELADAVDVTRQDDHIPGGRQIQNFFSAGTQTCTVFSRNH